MTANALRRAAVALARATDRRIITAGDRAPDACALLHHARETNRYYHAAWWSLNTPTAANYVAAARAVAGLAAHWMRARIMTARAPVNSPATARNRALIDDEFRHRCRVACIPGANGAPPAPLDWLNSYRGTPPTVT